MTKTGSLASGPAEFFVNLFFFSLLLVLAVFFSSYRDVPLSGRGRSSAGSAGFGAPLGRDSAAERSPESVHVINELAAYYSVSVAGTPASIGRGLATAQF